MNEGETGDRNTSAKINRLQISLVAQLFQIALNAHRIDEVFQWLAYAMVDQFDIQVIQFWTSSISTMDQSSIQLRTMVRQDASLPEQVVVNDQVAQVVQRMAHEHQPARLLAVDKVFLVYQGTLFRRYGLNYCVDFPISKDIVAPSQNNRFSPGSQMPMALTSLCLLQQPPHADLLPAINNIFSQTIAVTVSRGLLQVASTNPGQHQSLAQMPQQQKVVPSPSSLLRMVPHRKQDPGLAVSSNPFASSAIIADRQARRLYGAINGQMDVESLCRSTNMDMKTVSEALQILLKQQRIELHGPDDQLVHPSLFFKDQ
jgi:hypothetical protein